MYEDIYNDYFYHPKSASCSSPSPSPSPHHQAPLPPGHHRPVRYLDVRRGSSPYAASPGYRISKERCSALAVLAVFFLLAAMLATMLATQSVTFRNTSSIAGA